MCGRDADKTMLGLFVICAQAQSLNMPMLVIGHLTISDVHVHVLRSHFEVSYYISFGVCNCMSPIALPITSAWPWICASLCDKYVCRVLAGMGGTRHSAKFLLPLRSKHPSSLPLMLLAGHCLSQVLCPPLPTWSESYLLPACYGCHLHAIFAFGTTVQCCQLQCGSSVANERLCITIEREASRGENINLD